MVKQLVNAIQNWLPAFIAIMLIVGMTACANIDYQVGDFSKAYCNSDNQEFRTYLKARLNENGVKVGVDYCVVHGFVDVVVN